MSNSIPESSHHVKPGGIKRFLQYTLKLIPLREKGLCHPIKGYFCMTPQEFILIVAHEPKPVSVVVLAILQETIGQPGDGPMGRCLWKHISSRYFVRKGLLSKSQADTGLRLALERGYIRRRPYGLQTFEYSIHWDNIDEIKTWKNPGYSPCTNEQVWKTGSSCGKLEYDLPYNGSSKRK